MLRSAFDRAKYEEHIQKKELHKGMQLFKKDTAVLL